MKKELLNNCLYFKDERENPYEFKDDFKEWCWDMERVYLKHNGKLFGEIEYFEQFFDYSKYPNIPKALLCTMFTSWLKYSDYTPHERYNELFSKIVDRYLANAPR